MTADPARLILLMGTAIALIQRPAARTQAINRRSTFKGVRPQPSPDDIFRGA